MAPGIGDGWPEVIPAPHTPNARLKRMDGDPAKTITQLRADLSAARVKNRELNRREQSAMVAFRSAQEAIEKAKQEDGFRWAGGNLGRAFLAFDNNELRKDLSAARADAEAKGKLLAEAVEALEIDRIVGMFVCIDGITLEQCASLLKPYGFVGYSPEDWSEQKKQDTLSRLTSATQPGAGEKGGES